MDYEADAKTMFNLLLTLARVEQLGDYRCLIQDVLVSLQADYKER